MNYELRINVRRIAAAFVAVIAVSCIEPLTLTPDIVGEITALEVEGQTRTPSINTATRTVNIEMGEGADLSAVKVTRIELIETASCDVVAGSVLDLSTPLKVSVTTAARYEWTISATPAYTADRPLPGGDFEEWSTTGWRPTWNPWPEGAVWEKDRWWDTGNEGVTLLAPSNSVPTEPGEGCPANPEGRAVRLESRYALVKAAGGNIYFGRFGGLSDEPGSYDATCELGHNWQTKPAGLKGWYKYFPQPIDAVSDSHVGLNPAGLTKQQWLGSMDSLHVCVALWASPDGREIPFTVDTTPARFVDFSRNADGVLAYGAFVSSREQAEWDEFNIEMEYFIGEDEPLPANTPALSLGDGK